MINAMKKEVFDSGHIHREGGARRTLPEGTETEGSSLLTFMHATARDKFLPLLRADCRTMNAQVTKGVCERTALGGLFAACGEIYL